MADPSIPLSISLPRSYAEKIKDITNSRSEYFKGLVEKDFESRGISGEDTDQEADDIALIREARANGIDIATTLQAALLANLAK